MIRHYGIPVDDLEAAIEWWKQFYFLPLEYESAEINGESVRICKLTNKDNEVIELVEGKTAVTHISLSVPMMQFEALKNNENGMFEKEDVFYMNDDSGNVLEIVKNRGW